MQKELVVFSIPTLSGDVNAGLLAFTKACEKESLNPRVPWRFMTNIVKGYSPADYARNRLIQLFLQDREASKLWFLDADVVPSVDTTQMLSVHADIVAGLYPVWGSADAGRQPTAKFCVYDRMSDGRFRERDVSDETGPIYVDAAATGCMIINRKVLEDSRMEHPRKYYDTLACEDRELAASEPPPIFQWKYLPNGKTMCAEDLDFCARAKACGYLIKAHAGVRCGHLKRVDLMHVRQYRDEGVAEALESAGVVKDGVFRPTEADHAVA